MFSVQKQLLFIPGKRQLQRCALKCLLAVCGMNTVSNTLQILLIQEQGSSKLV